MQVFYDRYRQKCINQLSTSFPPGIRIAEETKELDLVPGVQACQTPFQGQLGTVGATQSAVPGQTWLRQGHQKAVPGPT